MSPPDRIFLDSTSLNMHLISCVLSLLFMFFASAQQTNTRPAANPNSTTVSTVWSWPPGSWAENVAVRRNGKLLVTRLDVPELWQVDPTSSNATLVHTFTSHLGLLGITEVTPDVFAIVVGNVSLQNPDPAVGTYGVVTIDLGGYPSSTPKVLSDIAIPEALLLNGLTTLNPLEGLVLAGDSSHGVVYSVDVHSGNYSVVLQDDTMAPAPSMSNSPGINGLKIRGEYLYYTNAVKLTFCRVKLNCDGTAAGPFEVLHVDHRPTYDDFAMSRRGIAYIAHTRGYGLTRITPGGNASLILEGVNATLGSTAAVFGRDWKETLYVVTSGGLAAGLSQSARVLAIEGLQ